MTNGWQIVQLGDVLKRVKSELAVADSVTYKQVTVRLWNKGVILRGEQEGADIKTKRQFYVKTRQLLMSRIDVRNGAIGLVPKELDGAIVSNDFWVYDFDEDQLYPEFLALYVRTPGFIEDANRTSSGTTKRIRAEETAFLNINIPLPPLTEQHRIVARIESLARRIHEAGHLREDAAKETEKLWTVALNSAFSRSSTNNFFAKENAVQLLERQATVYKEQERQKYNGANPWLPTIIENGLWDIPGNWIWTDLGSCLTLLVDCVNDTPNFAEQRTKFIGLKSTNIRPYKLNTAQLWYMTEEDFNWWNRREKPKAGDILITREAPMGNACIMPEGLVACLTQRIMLLRTDERFVITKFLLHFLNSTLFRQQVLEISRGLTTPHIRVQDMPKFKIPLPPLDEQRRIVAYLDGLQAKVNALRELQPRAGRSCRR